MMAEGPRDGGGGGTGIENHHLSFLHHVRRGGCNLDLFCAMQFFFFLESRIFECSLARGQSASMCAMDLSGGVKNLQIFANRDLRCSEVLRKLCDQHAAVPAHG